MRRIKRELKRLSINFKTTLDNSADIVKEKVKVVKPD